MVAAVTSDPDENAIDLSRLAPSLVTTCSDYLTKYRAVFADSIRRGASGVGAAQAFSSSLDGLFGTLYAAADAATRHVSGGGRIALVAVGGYGRGAVALHGDADVLVLCDDPTGERVGALVEALLYPLWNMGFDVGHVVRGVEETTRLAKEDVRTATTLLDLRRVAGDMSIVRDMVAAGRRQVFEPAVEEFLDAMVAEAEARHARFGDSLFLLEPEVKQGRGGLRDLDIAEWAGRAGFGVRTSEDLVRVGAVLPREHKQVEAAREMLWRVRNLLHLRAGRQHDRLTFADQEDIASDLGFVDGITLGVEQFMQAYYRHARVVAQMAERMVERARPQKRRRRAHTVDLGDGTMIFDGCITVEKTERLADDPALALRLYRQVARQKMPPYAYARDAITSYCADRGFRHRLVLSEEATQLFLDLVTYTQDAPVRHGSLLGELHETGLLVAMLPELEPLMGRVHHDVYHVYTVDVHTVLAVDRLRGFFRGETLELLPIATRLAADAPRALPLFVATLLHAVGKARGGDWVRGGADLSRQIAERLGLAPEDVDYVAFLVREQGALYRYATQRDSRDPEVVAEVAKLVGTVDRLRDLFLVNAAILSTVNPAGMTQWKARMLEELFLNTVAELEGDPKWRMTEQRIAKLRERAHEACGNEPRAVAFLDTMPDRYLLGTPRDVVTRHVEIARAAEADFVAVRVNQGPNDELTEIVVVTDDRPGLLSDAAAVLAANRFGIVDAQIYTHRVGERTRAFDVFHVSRRDERSRKLAPDLDARLTSDLRAVLMGDVDAETLVAKLTSAPSWAWRKSPDVPTEIFVDNESSSNFTVVDVFTKDRVGLLYEIASTLHARGLSISLSKVNTEGHRVADVFYVQDAGGKKLLDKQAVRDLRTALERRIVAFHATAEGEST